MNKRLLTRFALSTCFVVSTCAAATAAQGSGPTFEDADDFALETALGASDEIVAGYFTRDGAADAVVLEGTVVRLLKGAGRYRSEVAIPLSGDARSLAVIRNGNAAETDALLVATANGVDLVHWDDNSSAPTIANAGGPWTDPQRVVAARHEASQYATVAAVETDGRTIRAAVYEQSISGAPAAYYQTYPIAITAHSDVLDVELVQWDGAGAHEVAVLLADGLYVHSLGGGQSLVLPLSATGGHLTSMAVDGAIHERIACVVESAFGADRLHVADLAGGVEPALDLNGLDASGIVADDADADGDSDVAIATQSGFTLLHNQSDGVLTGVTFDLSAAHRTDAIGAHGAGLSLFDLEGDGDLDVIQASSTAMIVSIHRSELVEADDARPQPDRTIDIIKDTANTTFVFTVDEPLAPVPDATSLEVLAWAWDGSTNVDTLAPVDSEVVDVTGGWPAYPALTFANADGPSTYLIELRTRTGDPNRAHPSVFFGTELIDPDVVGREAGGIIIVVDPPIFPPIEEDDPPQPPPR